MTSRKLVKGENIPVVGSRIRLQVRTEPALLRVLLLAAGGRPIPSSQLLEPAGPAPPGIVVSTAEIELDLNRIPPDVEVVVALVAVPASAPPWRGVSRLLVWANGSPAAEYLVADLTVERALIVAEVYRRQDGWRLRAVGQGFAGGLPELLAAHGGAPQDLLIDRGVSSSPAGPPAASAIPPVPAPTAAEPAQPPPGTSDSERQFRQLQALFQDAARSTAGYRSAIDFAERRRERETESILADPRNRSADHPAAAAAARRYDELVMAATSSHQRDMSQLTDELDTLDRVLAAPMARWSADGWTGGPLATVGWPPKPGGPGGLRLGELTVPEAPRLRIPMVVGLPLGRPLWVDTGSTDPEPALTMALGIVIRILAAYPPSAVTIQLADGLGPLAAALVAGIGPSGVLADPWIGDQTGLSALLRRTAERIDLISMARTAGATGSLPPGSAGRMLLVLVELWPTADDDAALLQFIRQQGPACGVELLVVGDQRVRGADPDFLRLTTSDTGYLSDGWVGLSWRFTPDLGPTDPELAAALLRRMA